MSNHKGHPPAPSTDPSAHTRPHYPKDAPSIDPRTFFNADRSDFKDDQAYIDGTYLENMVPAEILDVFLGFGRNPEFMTNTGPVADAAHKLANWAGDAENVRSGTYGRYPYRDQGTPGTPEFMPGKSVTPSVKAAVDSAAAWAKANLHTGGKHGK